MRTPDEIQAAHDRLRAVLLGECPNPFNPRDKALLQAATGVLCWCLRHDHNKAFAEVLADIDDAAAAAGLRLVKEPT